MADNPYPDTPRVPQSPLAVVPATGSLTGPYLRLLNDMATAIADLQARVKALGG